MSGERQQDRGALPPTSASISSKRPPTGKSASARAAGDVANAVLGLGVLSFLIGCVGVWLGLFGVGSVVAAVISPWVLLAMPVVAYALWRWQRHRLECRTDPSSGRAASDTSTS